MGFPGVICIGILSPSTNSNRRTAMLDICISGATGWTDSELVRDVLTAPDLNLSSAVARASAGQDVGTVIGNAPAGLNLVPKLEDALAKPCDVLIEYTHPDQGLKHRLYALEQSIPVVLGTTGLNAANFDKIDAIARAAELDVVTGLVRGLDKLLFSDI